MVRQRNWCWGSLNTLFHNKTLKGGLVPENTLRNKDTEGNISVFKSEKTAIFPWSYI